MATLDRNVVVILAENPWITSYEVHDEIDQAVQDSVSVADSLNDALSPPISQFVAALQLDPNDVVTSCSTPAPDQPSQECFDNVASAIQRALDNLGISNDLTQLATQILQPINFACDSQSQCRFHPRRS